MTDQNTNPFVLPGMGQGSGETAGNPLLASMEMMRQAWAGLTGPGGLAQALPLTPPMNLQDLERRIAELRTVESWLRMNLSMLSSTIQGLEVQRSTIATLRSFVDNLGAQARDPSIWSGASPLEIALGLKPAPRQAAGEQDEGARESRTAGMSGGTWPETGSDTAASNAGTAASGTSPSARASSAETPSAETQSAQTHSSGAPTAPAAGESKPPEAGQASAQAISQAAQSASEAWWGMLQQQFNQLAAATAATMPGGAAGAKPAEEGAAGSAAAPDQGAGRADKTAARKSFAAKAGASRNGPTPPGSGAPRKTGVRKNKIQS